MAHKRTGLKNAKPEAAPPSASAALAQPTQGQVDWVLAACARVFRPMIRLAVAYGIKHGHLEVLLRDLLLDEARRAWVEKGTEPNISQLSVTTGLNRKAVTAKVREPEESLPRSEMSTEAKTITLWLQAYAHDPALRSLPIAAEGDKPSFEALARHASRGDLHHRAVLDELVRLGMVSEFEGRAELATGSFVPANDLKQMLAFLGDSARDHLLAGVSNTLGAKAPLLERSVFAGGISLADCERIHQFARERWAGLHHALTQEMTRAYNAAGESATGRIRVGIYTYYEDTRAEDTTMSAPTSEAPGKAG
jgi:hypothetical protein